MGGAVAVQPAHTYVRCMAWVLQNERGGGYWHPDSPQGVTLNRAERAYRFEERDEAEQVADRLNGTMIRGGEAVFNDGWVVIEGQAAAGTKPPRG
jgi:hypothetical protein